MTQRVRQSLRAAALGQIQAGWLTGDSVKVQRGQGLLHCVTEDERRAFRRRASRLNRKGNR
jgi:hypothetical protein